MKHQKLRSGFSLLLAIGVMVIMAGISVLILSLSGKATRSTTVQFQREQAVLLAKSYTEYAVMAVTANERNATCLEDINGEIGDADAGQGYKIKVNLAYLGNGNGLGDVGGCSSTRILSNSVSTFESPLTVLIDVYVKYKDPDNPALWVTYHRRTLQKI